MNYQVWNWQNDGAEEARQVALGRSSLRKQGLLHAFIGFFVGSVFYFAFNLVILSLIVISLSSITFFAALFSPDGLYHKIQAFFAWLGTWIGKFLTILLLTPIFYLFFLPFGFLFRRGKNDRMKRFFEVDATSYWRQREKVKHTAVSYERLY